MRLVSTRAALLAVGFAGLGCEGALKDYPAVSGCPVASRTCSPSGGKGMGAGGSGTTTSTGTSGSVNQSGSVFSIVSSSFVTTAQSPFPGPATIVALPSVGGKFTVPYPTPPLGAGGSPGAGGGASSDTFDLVNVPQGPAWFLVQDTTNGVSGIDSTFSLMTLPSGSLMLLPVVPQQLLLSIAESLTNLPSQGGVSPLAAQVVLVLTLNGAPYQGVSLTGGAGSTEVAYDVGPGVYSDTTTTTEGGGTIIVFNSGLSGPQTISLRNQMTMTAYSVPVYLGPGAVTLAFADFRL
jgi:hypothetical protein